MCIRDRDTSRAVKEELNRLSAYFPASLKTVYPYDTTPFIKISIQEVFKTLVEDVYKRQVVTSQMVDGDINRLRSIAGITHTAAWKNQRIITVDQNLILGMGPRIADVVESLHQQLWPQ